VRPHEPFHSSTRHLFFTGKGGVGKTALACAAAISLADSGKRVLKSDEEIRTIREELSGACTTEIAAFDQFAGLVAGTDAADFDHVVFDTAPTGHTLLLLDATGALDRVKGCSGYAPCCIDALIASRMARKRRLWQARSGLTRTRWS
jgi:hypothetical protein